MAEFLPANLGIGQLSNTLQTIYTVPAGKQAIIRSLLVVNTDSAVVTIDLFVQIGAVTARIIPALLELRSGSKYDDNSSIMLPTGAMIKGQADVANVVDYIISGVETVGAS
jgi:hypothetical protein